MQAIASTAPVPLGSDSGRSQLRDSLHSYFRSYPVSADPPRWQPDMQAPPASQPQLLLVGEPAELQASAHGLVESCGILSHLCHAAPRSPRFSPPAQGSPFLAWFEPLARPASTHDSPEGLERVLDSLRLRSACACDATPFDQLSPSLQREAAFEFAQELPCFDRDLTSLYLAPSPATPEYELHVAHSMLRLAGPVSSISHFTQHTWPRWREQGLLHVLALAAVNMPSPELDWRIDDETYHPALRDLLRSLPLARSYDAAAECISAFIATQDPPREASASMAATLDRLAVLMRVKSNACDSTGHCLDASLAAFPALPEPALDIAAAVPRLWAEIKPALELALPPSLLLPPPGSPAASVVW